MFSMSPLRDKPDTFVTTHTRLDYVSYKYTYGGIKSGRPQDQTKVSPCCQAVSHANSTLNN